MVVSSTFINAPAHTTASASQRTWLLVLMAVPPDA
jgi:hypothetical protein